MITTWDALPRWLFRCLCGFVWTSSVSALQQTVPTEKCAKCGAFVKGGL